MNAPSPEEVLDKKVVRTTPLLWILGFIFFGCLAALFSRVLFDIENLFPEPRLEQSAELLRLQRQHDYLFNTPDPIEEKVDLLQKQLRILQTNLSTAENNYETRLAAKGVGLQSKEEDEQLRHLVAMIEKARAERDQKQKEINELRNAENPRQAELEQWTEKIDREKAATAAAYQRRKATWSVKVILARVAFTAPFFLIGMILWFRRHRLKYITLFWGYEAAVLWTSLFAIVPYLPYYGGYIPLVLGSMLTVFVAISIVRYLNKRTSLRKQRMIDTFLLQHCCPACERNYLIGMEDSLEFGSKKGQKQFRSKEFYHFDRTALAPKQCPSCGFRLFSDCESCHTPQPAHLSYCSSCLKQNQSESATPL